MTGNWDASLRKLLLSALMASLLLTSCSAATTSPSIEKKNLFSGQKAFEQAKTICSFGPRVPGTRGWTQCADHIEKTMRALGYTVTRQTFTGPNGTGKGIQFTNIIAEPSIPSYSSTREKEFIICSHFDTRPFAERDPADRDSPILGANDGASGNAVMLELAARLKDIPLQVKPRFVFFDGEDYGWGISNMLYGSRHYAASLTRDQADKIELVILLDMIGDSDLSIPMEINSLDSAPLEMKSLWETAEKMGYSQFLNQRGMSISDDHIPFQQRGIKAIDLIDFDYPPWHTTADTLDKISAPSMEAVGRVLFRFIIEKWMK